MLCSKVGRLASATDPCTADQALKTDATCFDLYGYSHTEYLTKLIDHLIEYQDCAHETMNTAESSPLMDSEHIVVVLPDLITESGHQGEASIIVPSVSFSESCFSYVGY